jgi:hypothetical protein
MNPGIQQPAGLGIPERLFPDMPGRFMPSTSVHDNLGPSLVC